MMNIIALVFQNVQTRIPFLKKSIFHFNYILYSSIVFNTVYFITTIITFLPKDVYVVFSIFYLCVILQLLEEDNAEPIKELLYL